MPLQRDLFDFHGTGAIGPTLHELQDWEKIEVSADNLTTITAAGLAQLEVMKLEASS